jgi:superfamily II DNA or RNA helicase
MDKASEVPYRFGTTGTLDGKLVHELTLQGSFGPVYKVTTTRKLQQANTLAQLNISIISLLYPEEIRELSKKLTYQQELDYVVTHPGRNKFISNVALDQKGNTLLLFQFVEKHGKKLFELIENSAGKGRKVYFISGDTESTDREAIRKIVEKEKNAIICASFGVFSTGINIKNLHNIIFASPSKSPIRVLQSIGRGLRKSDNNQETQLLDMRDDLHWRKHKNYLLGHSDERIKLYEKENFKYKIYNINIE